MPRSLLALSLIFYSFHASAFFTASADKPDPYARRHYTAADLPAAKRKLAAQKALAKKTAQTKTPTDAEIMAEIEREDAGTEAGLHSPSAPKVVSHKITKRSAAEAESSVALKVESPAPVRAENRRAGPSSDEVEAVVSKNTSYRPSDKAADEFAAPAISAPAYPRVVVCRFSFPKKTCLDREPLFNFGFGWI